MQAEASNVFAFSNIFWFDFGKNKVVRGKRVIEGHCFFLCMQFFSVASIIMHSFLYISFFSLDASAVSAVHFEDME